MTNMSQYTDDFHITHYYKQLDMKAFHCFVNLFFIKSQDLFTLLGAAL